MIEHLDYLFWYTAPVLILFVLYRQYVSRGTCRSTAHLYEKTAIITGSNTGIGKETARAFVKRGARVILACRDVEKGQQAADEILSETGAHNSVVVRRLDLASLESVREFAENILKEENKIHILVNNAGLGWMPRTLTSDGFEMNMGVNHLGHFLLTNLLLERLKESAPSRVVTVSSEMHRVASLDLDNTMLETDYARYKAYANSKLANILFSSELARKLEGTGVTTYSLHPGTIYSEFPRNVPMIDLPVIRQLAQGFQWLFMKTVEQGAQTTIYCSVAPELETMSGKYYSECAEKEPTNQAKNRETAIKLWSISEKLVRLQ